MRALPFLPILALVPALAACVAEPPQQVARADYQTFCVNCHGATGTGDGVLAASLDPRPADLTLISARHGGSFPTTYVMSVIDGYSRGQHGADAAGPMPEFGDLLEGRQVLYDDGNGGPPVPTPERLLNLARYLESLQK